MTLTLGISRDNDCHEFLVDNNQNAKITSMINKYKKLQGEIYCVVGM